VRHLAAGFHRLVPDAHRRLVLRAAPAVIASLIVGIALGPADRPATAGPPVTNARTLDDAASRGQDRVPHRAAPAGAPGAKTLDYRFQLQQTSYYCGPAATRIAASALGHLLSQRDLADRLGTTTFGTFSARDTTRVLNELDGADYYRTASISPVAATADETDQLRADVVRAVTDGYPVVANIVGTATDSLGGRHAYGGGHYVTVVGYRDQGRTVLIADPADTVADGSYWVTTVALANWMASRGYSS